LALGALGSYPRHVRSRFFQKLAAALAITLCGTLTTTADAAPPAPRTTRTAPAKTTRRAKVDPSTAGRASRAMKGKPEASKKPPKKPEPPPRADSVGPPNDGRLENGIRLDTKKAYLRVVPAYQSHDTRWGLPALVHAIDRAAKKVHDKHPGAVLGVGDISRKGGGELAHHHSHESGRDADLGFYLVDEKGKPVLKHGFVKIDDKLAATDVPGARFDVARNWLFLQSLLLDRKARVSHVFVAEPIKHALLAHARARGVSRAVYVRAAQVMMQPTGGLPHDDHFHVRISCPPSMTKTCVEIAKNAPSKAKRKIAKKGRAGMKTPARRTAAKPKPKPKPKRAAQPTRQASEERPRGIYLNRTAKATNGPEVPASLWALAGFGAKSARPPAMAGAEEAESDAAEVTEALDEDGTPRITR